jgi:hypothetical protein
MTCVGTRNVDPAQTGSSRRAVIAAPIGAVLRSLRPLARFGTKRRSSSCIHRMHV